METSILEVELPKSDIEFLEQYAQHQGNSISSIINQYVKQLQNYNTETIHPDIKKITGIVPPNIDAKALYKQHLLEKHQ